MLPAERSYCLLLTGEENRQEEEGADTSPVLGLWKELEPCSQAFYSGRGPKQQHWPHLEAP